MNKTKFFIKHYTILGEGVEFFDIVRLDIDYSVRTYYEWIPNRDMDMDVFVHHAEVDWRLL